MSTEHSLDDDAPPCVRCAGEGEEPFRDMMVLCGRCGGSGSDPGGDVCLADLARGRP